MDQLTVNELLALCKEAIEAGLGDRKILISDDNEGNGYHGLFYGFTAGEYFDCIDIAYLLNDTEESRKDKIVILG